MYGLFGGLTVLGGLCGGFVFFTTLVSAQSAPQQAAGMAIAIAFAVIPYCVFRVAAEGDTRNRLDSIYREIKAQNPQPPSAPSVPAMPAAPATPPQPIQPAPQVNPVGRPNPFMRRTGPSHP